MWFTVCGARPARVFSSRKLSMWPFVRSASRTSAMLPVRR